MQLVNVMIVRLQKYQQYPSTADIGLLAIKHTTISWLLNEENNALIS